MIPGTGTTWPNGLQNNRFVTAKLRCGVVHTQDLINGQQRKNCHLTSRRSSPLQLLIPASIILSRRTSVYPTTCNGTLSPVAGPDNKTFSVIKNFGKRSSSTPTKNMSLSNHWTPLSEIPRLIFNASSNTPQSMPTTTRWCQHASNSKKSLSR